MLHTALFLISSLVAFAAAQDTSQCASGEIVCCNAVQSAYDVASIPLTTGISHAAAASLGMVGSTCTTLTVIGHGMSCATKQVPVCCADNTYNGTVCLGCTYIDPTLM